jgi:hypothetical protein
LSSRVQHVDQGLLSFDNTHLPIQIWSGGRGVHALALGDASTNVRGLKQGLAPRSCVARGLNSPLSRSPHAIVPTHLQSSDRNPPQNDLA